LPPLRENLQTSSNTEAGLYGLVSSCIAWCKNRSEMVISTTGGEFSCRTLINCAGLFADRVCRMTGIDCDLIIAPFRGEYCELAPDRRCLVNGRIYPVPDPQFPFLGVDFTRMVGGGVEAEPRPWTIRGFCWTTLKSSQTTVWLMFAMFLHRLQQPRWPLLKGSFSMSEFDHWPNASSPANRAKAHHAISVPVWRAIFIHVFAHDTTDKGLSN